MHFSRPHCCFNEESNGEIDIISTGCTGVPGLHRHTCRHTHMWGYSQMLMQSHCTTQYLGECVRRLPCCAHHNKHSAKTEQCEGKKCFTHSLHSICSLVTTEHSLAACLCSLCECTVGLVTQGRAAHTPHERTFK